MRFYSAIEKGNALFGSATAFFVSERFRHYLVGILGQMGQMGQMGEMGEMGDDGNASAMGNLFLVSGWGSVLNWGKRDCEDFLPAQRRLFRA